MHANLTIFKVKTSCNLYDRVKGKKKVSSNYKFCNKFGLATGVDGAGVSSAQCKSFSRTDPEYWMTGASSSFY